MERKRKKIVKSDKVGQESYVDEVSAVIDEVDDLVRQTPRRSQDESEALGTPGLTNKMSRTNADNSLASGRDHTSG